MYNGILNGKLHKVFTNRQIKKYKNVFEVTYICRVQQNTLCIVRLSKSVILFVFNLGKRTYLIILNLLQILVVHFYGRAKFCKTLKTAKT